VRSEEDVILRQFLMGGAISVCNIMIHAIVMTAVVRASTRSRPRAGFVSAREMIRAISEQP
jgi:hypothetical protein